MLMYFVDQNHNDRFNESRNKLPEKYFHNKEYLTLIYVATSNQELFSKVLRYFDFNTFNFHISDMFEQQDFSGGMRIMAELAVLFFNSGVEVSIGELSRLDDENFNIAMSAIKFRFRSSRAPYHFDPYMD